MAWLLMLARSRAIDAFRSRSRGADLEEALEAAGSMEHPGAGPEQSSLEGERALRVRAAIGSLPRAQREAILAAYFGGLSHTEVAEALGQPLGTVKTRIRAGMASLRRALASV